MLVMQPLKNGMNYVKTLKTSNLSRNELDFSKSLHTPIQSLARTRYVVEHELSVAVRKSTYRGLSDTQCTTSRS